MAYNYYATKKCRIYQVNYKMKELDKIQGKSRLDCIKQLQTDKTLIKMRMLNIDYEYLTIVTDIKIQNSIPYFIIDYTDGFREAVSGLNVWKILFEYTGKDKLKYNFSVSGGKFVHNEIWIKFPDYIERIQRRKNFRLTAPEKSKILFTIDSTRFEMDIINVSLGGVLGAHISMKKEIQNKPVLKNGDNLTDIKLIFHSKENPKIHIKKGRVVRLEESTGKTNYRYAIHFTDIAINEENIFTNLIYGFHRQFLRKRLHLVN